MLTFGSVNTLPTVPWKKRPAPASVTPAAGRSTQPTGWRRPGDSAYYSGSHGHALITTPPARYTSGGLWSVSKTHCKTLEPWSCQRGGLQEGAPPSSGTGAIPEQTQGGWMPGAGAQG